MKWGGEIAPDGFLFEQPGGTGDGVGQGLTTPGRKGVERVTRGAADPDCRGVAHGSTVARVDSFIYKLDGGGVHRGQFTGTDDDRLIRAAMELKATTDTDELTERLAELQELHDEVVPYTVHANAEEYVTVAESVHGLAPTLHNVILFDDAYIEE